MPSSTAVCSCSAVRPILPRPSARSVPRWRSLWPIWLRTCVIFTFATVLVVLLPADAALLRLRLHRLLAGRRGRGRGLRLGRNGRDLVFDHVAAFLLGSSRLPGGRL